MENHKEVRKNFYIKFSFVIALSCVFGVSQAYCIDSTKPSEANADILIKGRVDISNTIQGDSVDPKKQNPITTMVSSMPISDLPEDPGLPLNPDDPETPTDPTPFDPIDSDPEPLPQESVGTPHGSFSVSNSGSAVYDLKIDVPNGGSFTPQLSISYNSQSGGYGLAGFGFNIAGISAITRGGKDLFHDGQVKGTTYTGGDTYFLDGKRLILQSGTAGQNGAIYTVEGDPFTKVVVYGNYSNSTADTWFEVRSSDGTVYQYGNSTTSKLSYRNKTGYARIASWYINRATDKYSNYITYDYAIGTFFIRPISITYGTNLVKGRGIVNKISFSYQSLGNNTRPFAVEDQHGLIDVCLSSVTATCNNSIYRKYTFSYNDNSDQSSSKWTRLVTVEEANGTGEKLPPVRFTWQYLPSLGVNSSQLAVSTKDGSSFVEETSKQFLSADLNGGWHQ